MYKYIEVFYGVWNKLIFSIKCYVIRLNKIKLNP